jgi:hypothetical protein
LGQRSRVTYPKNLPMNFVKPALMALLVGGGLASCSESYTCTCPVKCEMEMCADSCVCGMADDLVEHAITAANLDDAEAECATHGTDCVLTVD